MQQKSCRGRARLSAVPAAAVKEACSHYTPLTGSGAARRGADLQNILAHNPDRQLAVTVRAGDVPVRGGGVSTTVCLPRGTFRVAGVAEAIRSAPATLRIV